MKLSRIFIVAILMSVMVGQAKGEKALSEKVPIWIPLNFKVAEVRVGAGVELPGRVTRGENSLKVYNPGYDFDVACAFNINFGRFVYIEPSLGAFAERYTIRTENDILLPEGNRFLSGRQSEAGIRFGVLLGGYVYDNGNLKLDIFTGWSGDVGCSGALNYNYRILKDNRELNGTVDLYNGNMDPYNGRWELGVGATLRHWHYRLSGAYGFSNRFEESIQSSEYRQSRVMFTVGYRF